MKSLRLAKIRNCCSIAATRAVCVAWNNNSAAVEVEVEVVVGVFDVCRIRV